MRLTDIPQLPNVVQYYADRIMQDDDAYMSQYHAINMKRSPFGGRYVGYASIKIPDHQEKQIPIILDDVMFQQADPLDNTHSPLGCMIVTIEEELFIGINQKCYDFYNFDPTRDITIGVIAHEVSHWMLGHMELDFPQDNQETDVLMDHLTIEKAKALVMERLSGQECGKELEIDTDICAINLIGIGPVVACDYYLATHLANIGVRMEFANRVAYHFDLLNSEPKRFTRHKASLEIFILSLNDIQKMLEDQKPTMRADLLVSDYDDCLRRVISEAAEVIDAIIAMKSLDEPDNIRRMLTEFNDLEHAIASIRNYYRASDIVVPLIEVVLEIDFQRIILAAAKTIHAITKLQTYGEVAFDSQTNTRYDNVRAMLGWFNALDANMQAIRDYYHRQGIMVLMPDIPVPVIPRHVNTS